MDRDTSIIVLIAAALVSVAALFGERARRRWPMAAHGLVPWHGLLFVGITGMLVMAVHLLAFIGQAR